MAPGWPKSFTNISKPFGLDATIFRHRERADRPEHEQGVSPQVVLIYHRNRESIVAFASHGLNNR
jgi:hypothetical protein